MSSTLEPPEAGTPPEAPEGSGFDRLGDYELLELIGSGGMGRVFKARQISLGRIVAVKILPPALARNQTYTLRFLREARVSGKLSHPNVVQGIDCGQDEGSGLWYFAMEYVDGHSLAAEMERSRVLTEARAIEVGIAVANALELAAQHGIVHRDIKPENILVSRAGEIKLADLGVAKIKDEEDASLTKASDSVGTPYYSPPEQARGQRDQVDTRSDIYALGATLFHLVTGQPPYEGETCTDVLMKHIQDKVPMAHRVDRNISEALSRVIAKMMQKQPAQRYQTPAEVREALERAKRGVFVGRGATSAIEPTGVRAATRTTADRGTVSRATGQLRIDPAADRHRAYTIGGIAVLTVCALLCVWLLRPRNSDKPAPGSAPQTSDARPASLTDSPPAPSDTTAAVPSPAPAAPQVLRGRILRIDLPGENRMLSLAEVQVFSGGVNVALKGNAVQSSTYLGHGAAKAIDGNTDGADNRRSLTLTNATPSPWWEVDLGSEYAIDQIVIWNRTELNYRYIDRLAGFSLSVMNADREPICRIDQVPAPKEKCILQPVIEAGHPVRLSWSMEPPITDSSSAKP